MAQATLLTYHLHRGHTHMAGIIISSLLLGEEDYLRGQACQDVATCS